MRGLNDVPKERFTKRNCKAALKILCATVLEKQGIKTQGEPGISGITAASWPCSGCITMPTAQSHRWLLPPGWSLHRSEGGQRQECVQAASFLVIILHVSISEWGYFPRSSVGQSGNNMAGVNREPWDSSLAMHQSARVAQDGGLTQQMFPHRSGDWRSKSKVAGRFSWGPLLGAHVASSPCVLTRTFLCVQLPGVSSSSYKVCVRA